MNHFSLTVPLLTAAFAMPAIALAHDDHDEHETTVLTEGHVDIFVDYNETEGLHFAIGAEDEHDHEGEDHEGEEHEGEDHEGEEHGEGELLHPEDVVIRGGIAGSVPSNPAFGFLGSEDDPFWFFPQVEEEGQPFPGFDTDLLEDIFDGPVTINLVGLTGPGTFSLYSVGSFGDPTVFLDFGDPSKLSFTLPVPTHAHFNWAFSSLGNYEVILTASVDGTDGPLSTEPTGFRFQVVPEPSVLSMLGAASVLFLLVLRRRS